jgi:hypothetical protein
VLTVDDRIQALAKQIVGPARWLRRSHENTPGFGVATVYSWYFPTYDSSTEPFYLNTLTLFSGRTHDCFHALRGRWWTLKVSSKDIPRAQGHISDIAERYGIDSNAYRIRVLGEFPSNEDEQVIPLDIVEAALDRDVEASSAYRAVWGLDVARFGSDRTALAKRCGNVLLEPVKSWRGKDTMQVVGLICAEFEATDVASRPSEIFVDVIGIGAGVVDRLLELSLPARGINVAERPSASDRYMRLRDELWFKARAWFDARDCRIPKDDALSSELTAPRYAFTSAGKLLVESKDELKKRGRQSPDLADAFLLTLAGGHDLEDDSKRERYVSRRRARPGSWMGV